MVVIIVQLVLTTLTQMPTTVSLVAMVTISLTLGKENVCNASFLTRLEAVPHLTAKHFASAFHQLLLPLLSFSSHLAF